MHQHKNVIHANQNLHTCYQRAFGSDGNIYILV